MRVRRLIILISLLVGLSASSLQLASAQVGRWSPLPSMSTARDLGAAAAGQDGHIYAIGGFNAFAHSILNTVEVFDPTTNAWTFIAPMPTARVGLAAATGTDGRIYAIGGEDQFGNALSAVEIYDPTSNTWSAGASLPTPRTLLATAVGKDGRIYAIGGFTFAADLPCCIFVFHDTVEIYDPEINKWSSATAMPTARSNLAAVAGLDGRIYALGGLNSTSGELNIVEVYDPGLNTWSAAASMPTPRELFAAVTRPGGQIFVMGGDGPSNGSGSGGEGSNPGPCVCQTVDAYDPTSNTWSSAPPLTQPHSEFGAAGAPDGRIYAVGSNVSIAASAAEVYVAPNAIDISRSSSSLAGDSTAWDSLKKADIQFVAAQAWGGCTPNPFVESQLLAAQGKALGTAAYILLNYTLLSKNCDPTQLGDDQVNQGLEAVGAARPGLSFVVLDVESIDGEDLNNSIAQRVERISEAVAAVNNAHANFPDLPPVFPVIYTDRASWQEITGNSFGFASLPLWDTTSHIKRPAPSGASLCGDGLAKLERDCITDSTTPPGNTCIQNQEHSFTPYPPSASPAFGWLIRKGKQYDLGDISCVGRGTIPFLMDADIDLDVFAPSLFSEPAPNTPTGNNVLLQPPAVGVIQIPVSLLFPTVVQAGRTTLTTMRTGPIPPAGFALGIPPLYIDITSTAIFTGIAQVCINYAAVKFSNPSAVKLFHFEGGAWFDRTKSLNPTDKTVCGGVTSFSPFAIFESVDTTPPVTTASLTPAPNGKGWNDTNVTVNLSSTDNEPGGTGVREIHIDLAGSQTGSSILPGATASVPVTDEGTTTVGYFGVDNAGNVETTKTLTVQIDKMPPSISGMPASGCMLWPPNHKLIQVATVIAFDALSGLAAFTVNATSSEASADHDPEIVITGGALQPQVVQLRMERLGSGPGRLYTVTATATDLAGNTTTLSTTCTVPHDRGN